jgi:hypothetical protein
MTSCYAEQMAAEEQIYGEAKKYWESVPATVSGMLDGFTQINSVDLAASNKFLRSFIQVMMRADLIIHLTAESIFSIVKFSFCMAHKERNKIKHSVMH